MGGGRKSGRKLLEIMTLVLGGLAPRGGSWKFPCGCRLLGLMDPDLHGHTWSSGSGVFGTTQESLVPSGLKTTVVLHPPGRLVKVPLDGTVLGQDSLEGRTNSRVYRPSPGRSNLLLVVTPQKHLRLRDGLL